MLCLLALTTVVVIFKVMLEIRQCVRVENAEQTVNFTYLLNRSQKNADNGVLFNFDAIPDQLQYNSNSRQISNESVETIPLRRNINIFPNLILLVV